MQKKKQMTREDAAELYRDLQRTMQQMKTGGPKPASNSNTEVAKQIAAAIREGMKRDEGAVADPGSSSLPFEEPSFDHVPRSTFRGEYAAVAAVVLFAVMKISLSALEAYGIGDVKQAQAAMVQPAQRGGALAAPGMRREEIRILTSLDDRRHELEERRRKLDEREVELDRRDREFAGRLTELRDLTNQVKAHRENSERKRSNQLEQLSNVYGSMNPPEAAQLIEQLDITIALALLERMPEKRIGQILSLMSPERALTLTKLLSGSTEE